MSIYSIFFIKKHVVGYSLEAPRRGASNEYPQRVVLHIVMEK